MKHVSSHVGRWARVAALSSGLLVAGPTGQAQVTGSAQVDTGLTRPVTAEARRPNPAAARLETEYKLSVPAGQGALIWRWLRTTYATTKPRALGANWVSALGEERFEDRYFDDPARTLLRARAGLRHRRRYELDGTLKKQLVQLKTTDDSAGLLREELKFKPADDAAVTAPLTTLLRAADRPRLDSALQALGVRLEDLSQALVLHQRRQRLYLRADGDDYSTITLDSSYHAGEPPASFVEIEVELNEKRFTGASVEERARMQTVLAGIRADLLGQFPGLEQDQRPKYQKLAELLPAGSNTAASPPARGPRLGWGIAGAVLGIGLAGWMLKRRRSRVNEG